MGCQKARKPAEFLDQLLGQRLGIAARNRQREQLFDQFVIVPSVALTCQYTVTEAGAVPAAVTRQARTNFICLYHLYLIGGTKQELFR